MTILCMGLMKPLSRNLASEDQLQECLTKGFFQFNLRHIQVWDYALPAMTRESAPHLDKSFM